MSIKLLTIDDQEALRNDKQTIGLIWRSWIWLLKAVEFGDHELDTWLFWYILQS
jgi:hypothetical protein